jgi:hypothetical protein
MLKENISCRLINTNFASYFGIIIPFECSGVGNIEQNILREQNKDLVSCYQFMLMMVIGILGGSLHIIKKLTEPSVVATKENGL